MPVWGNKPDEQLNETLTDVWEALSEQVADRPKLEEVVGVPMEKLVKHASQACEAILGVNQGDLPEQVFAKVVQIYCLGFVIGSKYEERLADQKSTMKERDTHVRERRRE